jgi:hypothetical protein
MSLSLLRQGGALPVVLAAAEMDAATALAASHRVLLLLGMAKGFPH